MTGSVSDRVMVIAVFYRGPWERAAHWLLAIDPHTGETWREVPGGCLRDRLACWCDYRDKVWAYKYAVRDARPHPRWKRPR